MALGSDSDDEQEAAVRDCFAIARRNADALIAVRRCFLYMLLFEDPGCRELARRTAIATVTDAPMVSSWATAVCLLEAMAQMLRAQEAPAGGG